VFLLTAHVVDLDVETTKLVLKEMTPGKAAVINIKEKSHERATMSKKESGCHGGRRF
jgi:hypothetical protein